MSGYHDLESCRRGIEVELGQVVQDVDRDLVHPKRFGFGDRTRPAVPVVVAAHRGHGSERAQRLEQGGAADVAGVDDEVAAAQELERLRPQQAVGIGKKPDARSQSSPQRQRGGSPLSQQIAMSSAVSTAMQANRAPGLSFGGNAKKAAADTVANAASTTHPCQEEGNPQPQP